MKTVEVRGVTIGEGRSKILASLCGKTAADAVEQARALAGTPVDIAEWRVDWFDGVFDRPALMAAAKELREAVGDDTPLLLTFRTAKEGGEKAVEPDVYADINLELAKSGLVDLIDVEAFTGDDVVRRIIEGAHEAGVFVIASNHDFDKTLPKDEIVSRLRKMQDLGADVAKIALMPQSRADVITLLDATREMFENYAEVPLITMSMSGLGVVSRLVGESFGSAATFGAAAQASAPGQVGVKELEQVLDTVHAGL